MKRNSRNTYYINQDDRLGDAVIVSEQEIIDMMRDRIKSGDSIFNPNLSDKRLIDEVSRLYRISKMGAVKIEDLEVGDCATDGKDVSIVSTCIHGTKFYQYIGLIEFVRDWEVDTVYVVLDMDDNKLPCCS